MYDTFGVVRAVRDAWESALDDLAYKRYNEERITIDGITKTRYEWTQKQRLLESAIRERKDVANLAKASGDDFLRREAQAHINKLDAVYGRINEGAGLIEQRERMSVAGFRRVKAIEELKGTPRYATIKTEQNRPWLQKGYNKAVEKGDISALTGFEHYMKTAERVERDLVGLTTNDGVTITGYKTHFVDRVIGSYEKKREPVDINNAKNALLKPGKVSEKRPKERSPSNIYETDGCKVAVNPKTGELIQTTPRKKGGPNDHEQRAKRTIAPRAPRSSRITPREWRCQCNARRA